MDQAEFDRLLRNVTPGQKWVNGVNDEQFNDLLKRVTPAQPERSSFGSSVAANFLPFSAAQRQFNTDPYLREARDMTDKLMATVPGLSDKVPARYDPFGDPITTRKGMWSNRDDDLVDTEVMRLALENGSTISRPTPSHEGVDLRDITLSDGRNAFAVYQEYAGHLPGVETSLKQQVKKMMETPIYKRAPDGDMGTKGTKLWLLYKPISKYREAAMKLLKKDPVIREAFTRKDRKVIDAYRSTSTKQQRQDSAKAALDKIGASFGVGSGD